MPIEYLADHIHTIPELASMHFEFFSRFNAEMTLESRAEQLHARIGRNTIPLTLVAIEQETPIGSASLVEHDMDSHPELSPWVASVIVRSDSRRQGIGTALMKRIENEALGIGVKKLYLFTPDMEDFYATLDWVVIGREMYRDNDVTIMEKVISL